MNCSQAQEHLPALIHNDLRPEETAAVEEHLAGCPSCRREQAALQDLGRMLDRITVPAVQVDLPRLYRHAAMHQERRVRRFKRLAWATFGAAAAILALAVGMRLEVRAEAHQVVLRWGTPPPVLAAPAPEAPTVSPAEEQLAILGMLIHALATDIEAKDRRQQENLLMLQAQLHDLIGSTEQRHLSLERDVAALYTAQFDFSKKGTPP